MTPPRRLIFVTTELHPETPGGAGVVVDALARGLAPSRDVHVVLGVTQPFDLAHRSEVTVRTVLIPDSGFLERSVALAEGLAGLARPGDRVEFHDFEGIGFSALVERPRYGLESVSIGVRFHGPYHLLSEAMDTAPGDWAIPMTMERAAFRMADQVLIPVEGHRPVVESVFGVDPHRIVVSPPRVPTPTGSVGPPAGVPTFAVIGRLGEMKGSQDMVRAALLALDTTPLQVKFIGDDGWSPTAAMSMRGWLESLIPDHRRHAFTFEGPVPRADLAAYLDGVTAVVVPSRFESFCLAAYEARMLGLPVVVPDLPAFQGLFGEESGALVYDGSTTGLAAALDRLASDRASRDRLAKAPAPDPGDPWRAYQQDDPPRHPRSQAGLATEAVKALEASMIPTGSRRSVTLGRLYGVLPEPLARAAARLAPAGLKRRLRSLASWPEERARVERDRRLAQVERRMKTGVFPEVDEPEVSLVIPVHDSIAYLDEALASVYGQTHQSWEIIVVDDGSSHTDTVRRLEALDRPRLRLVRQPHRGLPSARNAGMRLARGRFLVPLDSDDEIEPTFIEEMLEALSDRPQAAFAHCLARLTGDVNAYWIPRPFNPYWELLENGVVGCVMLRTEAWREAGGYDETMTSGNEDWELWVRLLGGGWGEVRVEKPLFRYRKHGLTMSVGTEARFEEGRRMVRDRHPDLYTTVSLRARKQTWYPLLTVVGARPEQVDDVEWVAYPRELATTWGKYVVDLTGHDSVPLALLRRMADLLEATPEAAAAQTTGNPPLVLTRRWVIHDPEAAPKTTLLVDDPASGTETPAATPGSWPRQGWVVPEDLRSGDVPVQRQRPEAEGTLPDPSTW